MLKMLEEHLIKEGVFNGTLPPILQQIAEANPNPKIPYRMKLTIAVSELVLFSSHLRRNILHWNESLIPINAISFAIAGSGEGKDSSVSAVRKCFKDGYKVIETKRKDLARINAQRAARSDGKEDPEKWEVYKDYYHTPNPLFVSPSTSEGFIQHLNDLESAGIGAGYIQSGEFGAELVSGGLIIDNIKLLSEIYDEGNKEVKVLKARENQSKEIKNLPVSALLMGSQDNLLYDESVKKVFRREFSTKLARRSYFMFFPEKIQPIEYSNITESRAAKRDMEDKALKARASINESVKDIANDAVNGAGQPITISEEVRDLFGDYEQYNDFKAEEIKAQYPISKLVRKHLQWKALKLAGALTIFSGRHEITKQDYISAISFGEMLDKDMQMFEAELVKEPYEIFVDFMHRTANDGKSNLGIHALRKLGYIPTSGTAQTKMKELVILANSYDKTGVFTVCEEGICYEEVEITDIIGVSYLSVDNTPVRNVYAKGLGHDALVSAKNKIASKAVTNYTFDAFKFDDLSELLGGDFAYSPFQYMTAAEGASYDEKKHPNAEGCIRGKDNIVGGCKWICLDVDDSIITDKEAHFMLSDINHHIARTSDPDNEFKFRVLVELDGVVDVPNSQWIGFIQSISDSLSLKSDKLAKSQLFVSYEGEEREILSVTDATPLEVKEHLVNAATSAPKTSAAKPTPAQAKQLLNDELTTFSFAFEAENGVGGRMLMRAAYYASDLGMKPSEIIELVHRINDSWIEPMEASRLERTIISQVRRM